MSDSIYTLTRKSLRGEIERLTLIERKAKALEWLADQVKDACYSSCPAWLRVSARYDSDMLLEIVDGDLFKPIEAEMERKR